MRYMLTIDYGYIKQFPFEAGSDRDAAAEAERILSDPANADAVERARHKRLDRVNGGGPKSNESRTVVRGF